MREAMGRVNRHQIHFWNIAHPQSVFRSILNVVAASTAAVVRHRDRRSKMKTFLSALYAVAAVTLTAQRPSDAWVYATDLYPYCSVQSSTGGMNCYISSRAQCESRDPCIDNPRYLGAE